MTKEAGKKGARGTGYRSTMEFRREALRMIVGGKTMAAVCEELGVTQGTLNYWKLKAAAGAGHEAGTGIGAESVTAENNRLKREVKALRQELEFAKKSRCLLRAQRRLVFPFIASEKANFTVSMMCKHLEVSKSGYYAWETRRPSRRLLVRKRSTSSRSGSNALGWQKPLRQPSNHASATAARPSRRTQTRCPPHA